MSAYQTVMVGTDGSDSSYRAVDRAAEVARDAAAKLVIVCAYTPATREQVAEAEEVLGDEAYQVVGSSPADETLRTATERAAARARARSNASPWKASRSSRCSAPSTSTGRTCWSWATGA
jgi:nucleotide-binding universal stress UspA family protein